MENALKNRALLLPYSILMLSVWLWASSLVALKIAFAVYDPMVVIFSRMVVAVVFIVLFLKPLRNVKIQKKDLKYLAFLGLCEPCLYFIFEAIALQNTSASQAGMVTATLPLFVAILAWLILKEKITLLIKQILQQI